MTTGARSSRSTRSAKHAFTGRPGATGINVWTTEGFPANNDGPEDAGLRKVGHDGPDGTIFRILEFAPGLAARNHRTDSIDYIVVLSGEIEMELDDTVVRLKAGDVMVQRGTIHNWVNRGTPAVRARGHPDRRQAGRGRRQGAERGRLGREAPLAAGRLTTTPPTGESLLDVSRSHSCSPAGMLGPLWTRLG